MSGYPLDKLLAPAEVASEDRIHASIEIARGKTQTPGMVSGRVERSYGCIAWGLGTIRRIWGTGFAPTDDIMRAHAVRRLLADARSAGAKLSVSVAGLKAILDHAYLSDGTKADGKPFVAHDLLKGLELARIHREWTLSAPFKSSSTELVRRNARGLAEENLRGAFWIAERLREESAPDVPHAILTAGEEALTP